MAIGVGELRVLFQGQSTDAEQGLLLLWRVIWRNAYQTRRSDTFSSRFLPSFKAPKFWEGPTAAASSRARRAGWKKTDVGLLNKKHAQNCVLLLVEAPEIWETIFNPGKQRVDKYEFETSFLTLKNFNNFEYWWAIVTLDRMLMATLEDVSKWAARFHQWWWNASRSYRVYNRSSVGRDKWGMSVKLKKGYPWQRRLLWRNACSTILYTASTSVSGVGSRKAGGEKKIPDTTRSKRPI